MQVGFGVCLPSASAAQAAAMGYDFVELRAAELAPEGEESAFRAVFQRIAAAGVPALSYNFLLPPDLQVVGPQPQTERFCRYISVLVERAATLGGKFLVFGSGRARRVSAGFPPEEGARQYLDAAARAGDIAQQRGLTVLLEPLNRTETNLLHTVAEGAEWARRLGHPGVAVLADAYHMEMSGEPFHNLLDAVDQVRHVHVCDHARGRPGTGGMDLGGFCTFLNAAGYQGNISIEAAFASFAEEGPRALAVLRHAARQRGEVTFAP